MDGDPTDADAAGLGAYTTLTSGLSRADAELFCADLEQLGVPAHALPTEVHDGHAVYEIQVPESLREVCEQVVGKLLIQPEGSASEAEILADLAADQAAREAGRAAVVPAAQERRRPRSFALWVILLSLATPLAFLLIRLLWW